ncbi:phage tail sheath C-terminal domain-containing protein [Microbacterium sp. SSM24]|uniref:phage tail sheath C-terminal domain-containing protein n=1 Tax=Microbacterium sp. SSM24 TaxID=2991714 RepID=UPI002226849B|nr:phage tail sheath C-terminal domain-containing protein [Microbacterium sp. SSM24]MCW3494210.1 phage tail sheath subtilisin-like domain-containing protein [Microbacterium sp. SSM24]
MDGRAPGVLIQFADPPPAIEPSRIDVPVLVCVTERGPVDTPVRCASWTRFVAGHGGFIPNGLGAYAAKAFFDNGGGPAWVVRVAAPERTTATAGPQPADRSRSVVAAPAGLIPGAVATLRQGDLVRAYLVTATDAATSTITWDRPLHPGFDTTLAITVATGAGSAAARCPDEGGADAIEIEAATPGSWGDRLEVVVSGVLTASTAPRTDAVGTAAVTPVVSTVGFAVGDSCRITQDIGGVVAVETAVVALIDAAHRVLSWTTPLAPAIDVTRPFTIESRAFDLAVLEAGLVAELWPGLTCEPAHPRFAERVLAASALVRGRVLGDQPAPARARLAGGRDGTAALAIADLLGDELTGIARGLAAVAEIDEPAVVVMPDLVAPPTPPLVRAPLPVDPCDPCRDEEELPDAVEAVIVEAGATFDAEQIIAAQQAVIETCERNTERIVLLDPPSGCRTLAQLRDWAARFSSSYAVTIAPGIGVVEPSDSRALRTIPASGHLAGLISACDTATGPWLSAANRSLVWAHSVSWAASDAEHAAANDDGINLVRPIAGRGLVPLGARTMAADDEWTFAAVRRTMIWLRRTLRHHLAWVVFEPITPGLATLLTGSIGTLLTDVWEAGGLSGAAPDESFFVAVDTESALVGELRIVVGVALARPAEFVTVTVTRTGNRLELNEEPVVVLAGGA